MLSRYLHPHDNVDSLKSLLQDLTHGDEVRAGRAVTELAASGEAAIPALLELANSSDSDSRWWALRTLAQSPHLRTEWLIPFLNDSSPEVRQCAALGLATKPDEIAIQVL